MWNVRGRRLIVVAAVATITMAIVLAHALACGPFFDNRVLCEEDRSILASPRANFAHEMRQLVRGRKGEFVARPPTDDQTYCQQRDDAETTAIQAAMKGMPEEAIAKAIREYFAMRATLAKADAPGELRLPAELPRDFRDYLAGAQAFGCGDDERACEIWQKLVDARSKPRAVWAAYMIGRARMRQPMFAEAIEAFRTVRELAGLEGFDDSTGLATASLGWEARCEMDTGNFDRAVELYLEQLACGDQTAIWSLRDVARSIFSGPAVYVDGAWESTNCDDERMEQVLIKASAEPHLRPVLAAYIAAQGGPFNSDFGKPGDDLSLAYLKATEHADIRDARDCAYLAWAAYDGGHFDMTRRWLERAPKDSPVANWLRAKMLLREGKLPEAAAKMAMAARHFPRNDPQPSDCLQPDNTFATASLLQGELAAMKLASGQFVDALDLLVRHGWSEDAAYVAERVLTVQELTRYVDRNFPPTSQPAQVAATQEAVAQDDDDQEGDGEEDDAPRPTLEQRRAMIRDGMRPLLGRRLVREGQYKKALKYLHEGEATIVQGLAAQMSVAQDIRQPDTKRALAFRAAAKVIHDNGMEIMGSEGEPDWRCFGGNFERETIIASRRATTNPAGPSGEELTRLDQHAVEPDSRFHYRYVAADLAWQAARLMDDQTDETADVLCEAGTWLKARDPKAADRFYKALVIRCGKTKLGQEADKLRWFPKTEASQEAPQP